MRADTMNTHSATRGTDLRARGRTRSRIAGCGMLATVLSLQVAAAPPRTMTVAGDVNTSQKPDLKIEGTDKPERFNSEVYGKEFSVTAGDLPAGNYCVEIDLAEIHFGERDQRVMSVHCGGTTLIRELDILAVAGGPNRAYTLSSEIRHAGGEFTLRFETHKDNAKFGAIRVLNAQGEVVAEVLARKVEKPPPKS